MSAKNKAKAPTCHPGPLQRLRVYRLRPILGQVQVMPLDAPDVLLPAIQPLPDLHHIAIPLRQQFHPVQYERGCNLFAGTAIAAAGGLQGPSRALNVVVCVVGAPRCARS